MLMKKLSALCAIVIIFFTIFQSCQPSSKQVAAPADTHLGEMMGQMQYYVVKLGLALQHRNQPLASFYMNEVNETYQDIVDKNIMLDSLDISKMIQEILAPAKNQLSQTIQQNDTADFLSGYHAMIMKCNNCHHETNHQFIVIEEPHEDFNGQNFNFPTRKN